MSGKSDEEKAQDSQALEPFLVKGDILSIPNLTFSVGDNGKLELQPITLYTGSDMCLHWLRLAYNHLLMTEEASNALIEAKKRSNNDEIGNALNLEFSSGMQAIMASVIAIDAFYASVKEHVVISAETAQAWHDNGTARYKQVAEVFRLAFRLDNADTQSLRKVIKRLFYFRNRAVHPSSKALALALHPQLGKATNWWYAAFCFQNAKMAFSLAFRIVVRSAGSPRKEDYVNLDLAKYCRALVVKTKPLIDAWEERYGGLFEETA